MVAESLVFFGTTLSLTFRNLKFLPSSDNFQMTQAYLRSLELRSRTVANRSFREVRMVGAKNITVVVNDVDAVVEAPQFQLFLASRQAIVPALFASEPT